MCVCAVGERLARRRSAVRAPSRTRSASASRKPERRRVPPGARLARAAVGTNTLSRPGRALARRADGDVPFYGARTRDCLPSQLGRTTGAAEGAGRTANLAPPERARARAGRRRRRPPGCGLGDGGTIARSRARLPAAHRSGRVSGIRPSDRRGPGPAGHRGRNVRSTGRCSYNLRITRRRADSCGLHRSTSQVIRRSGSGVFFIFRRRDCSPRARV